MFKLQDILSKPSLNGVYRLRLPPESVPMGLVPVLDGRSLADRHSLLAALGHALDFPDYYGGNWDALEECLSDLSWRSGPVSMVIHHAGAIPGDQLGLLLDVFAQAAAYWSTLGRAFSLFLTGYEGGELPEAA